MQGDRQAAEKFFVSALLAFAKQSRIQNSSKMVESGGWQQEGRK